ncbi:MAG: DUF512 domain-containing protein [Lachnospiraceae bacterium]|nr:DUF512 domain-containing protein [Lachnospiraceae bacterium]
MKDEQKQGHEISGIVSGSIAEELGLKKGDRLISINGKEIKDVFDYHFLTNDEELTLYVITAEGEEWELEVEKDFEEDLGLEFDGGLMDKYRSCRNKCIFCFIDQNPPGMRESLYFKDDDARLSFLQGNYVTLTNMSDEDVDRICFYKLSPINVSIHTTNPELRCRMLNNRFAGEALKKIERFKEAGIELNGQIVLCKGFNDGAELDRTLKDIEGYLPSLKSLSVVPVGLTKYREGLEKLEVFNKEESRKVIAQIEGFQKYYLEKHGTRLVYASDEWYLKGEVELPPEEAYEGYPQIENGVGMMRSIICEFDAFLEEQDREKLKNIKRRASIVTGTLAEPVIRQLAAKAEAVCPGLEIMVYPIVNNFFGPNITVTGLITGKDLTEQLRGKDLGDELILKSSMFRSGDDIMLDDMHMDEVSRTLQSKLRIVQSSGASLAECFFGL